MKRAILLVAYGPSNIQGQKGLKIFDAIVRQRFPDCAVRWAFSSDLQRERLLRERRKSDSVEKALHRLNYEGHEHIAIQPLQVVSGKENEQIQIAVDSLQTELGISCAVGRPLMTSPESAKSLAKALFAHLPPERNSDDDILFVGHGSKDVQTIRLYDALAVELSAHDGHIFLGVMSGEPGINKILLQLDAKRVWLLPLLASIGRHALEDIAGNAPDSWRSQIEARGIMCKPMLKGLVEMPELANIWLCHLEDALNSL